MWTVVRMLLVILIKILQGRTTCVRDSFMTTRATWVVRTLPIYITHFHSHTDRYALTGHFVNYTVRHPFVFRTDLIFHDTAWKRSWKHSSESLVHIDRIASHSCCIWYKYPVVSNPKGSLLNWDLVTGGQWVQWAHCWRKQITGYAVIIEGWTRSAPCLACSCSLNHSLTLTLPSEWHSKN